MISPFELQIITIVNFKPHKLFDSSILNFDGTTFCSPGFNFDGGTFCLWALKSPTPFFNLLPLTITTFNIKKTIISLLIVNFNELDQKTKEKEKEKKKKGDPLLPLPFHNTITIEEGDDIVVVTFFIAKPPKKVMVVIVTIFCNKAIEEGDGRCRIFLLLKHKEEGDGNSCHHFLHCNKTT